MCIAFRGVKEGSGAAHRDQKHVLHNMGFAYIMAGLVRKLIRWFMLVSRCQDTAHGGYCLTVVLLFLLCFMLLQMGSRGKYSLSYCTFQSSAPGTKALYGFGGSVPGILQNG